MGYAISTPVDLSSVAKEATLTARSDVATSTRAATSATTKIKSIQRGQIIVPAASQAHSVTIATVNTATTDLLLLGSVSTDPNAREVVIFLNSAASLGVAKAAGASVADTEVRYQLTEWV